ncbi:hypothetical protein [Marinicellulosiphila megalodicopiae]|uniref:hypothetical protein n=1 Tax=Marinicellulosiphila megalodicopiae TaxID=2724896 RepID=UPI003BB13537
MIQSPEGSIIDILCSLDETLSSNSIVMRQSEYNQYLIHQATLKILDWLKTKLKLSIQLHLEAIESIDEQNIRFTLTCHDFAQTLFFKIKASQNGQLKFSSNVDFNSDIYVQELPQQTVVA